MCDYCNPQMSRYRYKQPERLPIIDTEIDIGDFGKSHLNVMIKNAILQLEMNNYGVGGKTTRRDRHINFCPICGSQLGNKEGDNTDDRAGTE